MPLEWRGLVEGGRDGPRKKAEVLRERREKGALQGASVHRVGHTAQHSEPG